MINTVIPETSVPSHQGPDADGDPGPGHHHAGGGRSPQPEPHPFRDDRDHAAVSVDELRATSRDAPRIAFVRADGGVVALNSVIELMRDLGRPRGDMWEVAVWEDALAARRARGVPDISGT